MEREREKKRKKQREEGKRERRKEGSAGGINKGRKEEKGRRIHTSLEALK